jgi:formylglycine-generating enzyme required for sulfatase activity
MAKFSGAASVSMLVLLAVAPAHAKKCPLDSVQVGGLCVDKYEASVWEIPATSASVINAVKKGKVLSAASLAGATQRGATSADYGAACPRNGSGCTSAYAVSVPGVTPSRFITWFQAAAACRNSGKRLLTNQEWTVAALGTPEVSPDDGSTQCYVNVHFPLDPVNSGSRSACVSDTGAHDMVGNLWEWVADWSPFYEECVGWDGLPFSDDIRCLSGADATLGPGALIRGGAIGDQAGAGPLAVSQLDPSSSSDGRVGFRCARAL